MAPPPPPPPPPLCFPFIGSKPKRRLSWSNSEQSRASYAHDQIRRPSASRSQSQSLNSDADTLTFHTDSEKYDDVPLAIPDAKGRNKLARSNTMTGTKKSTVSNRWGYGWGIGKQKEKLAEVEREREFSDKPISMTSQTNLPLYQGDMPVRRDTQSSKRSGSTQNTKFTTQSRSTQRSKSTHRSNNSKSSPPKRPGPVPFPNESSSTLVGSAYERKINDVESIRERVDTTERLEELRKLMSKDNLDYYIVPSEDAHQSEYVSKSDKRREFISGFTGTAGDAIITRNSAYLIADSRYWLQARDQVDPNWIVIEAGSVRGPKDWIDWLTRQVNNSRIGIDARMLAHDKATLINSKISPRSSKMIYPPQNLVDLVWKDKPPKSKEPVFTQPIEFAGEDASSKLHKLRDWIREQPAAAPSYQKSPPTPSQIHVATLITSLSCIAYLLNLRGSDVPFNPLFQAYLFVGLDRAVVFLEASKVNDEIASYLKSIDIERRDYTDIWTFLRRREWGDGKILISPQTSYAISLMLTHFRYTPAPSYVEIMMSQKNETEIEGLRRAYLRDGVSYVRWLAWLESKLSEGYDITEYEAASRLTEFRRHNKHFMGLAYENISASGPNAALPHYTPKKSTARMIDRDTPYLNDSGGQYRDGTCDTTRTVHFGRPTAEQCEAFTRVLQGHIAIDSAVFPEGTSGHQLDVLARKALWKDGMNYMHGTGHGFGSFLTVHEGPQGFSSSTPLMPGHVITNEPGFYNDGKWGMRIESALVIRRVETKRGSFNDNVWLGFERLTHVPIQTKMVKENMLSKEEKQWLKDHNQRCLDKLSPYLRDDKRAMKWLKRETERGIGIATGPGGMSVDWN